MTSGEDGSKGPPQTPVLTVGCRMLRSPSHESVTTDLSLFSVSSLASEAAGRSVKLVTFRSHSDMTGRGPSPNPESKGQTHSRPPDIPEILWFEEENELIRSCAALSSALGLQKSFSTSDISQLPSPEDPTGTPAVVRSAVSDLVLSSVQRTSYLLDHPRLEHASRSCSTWVAVGDVSSTSQLPSPHGGHTTSSTPAPPPPFFTAADLIRSVNKKELLSIYLEEDGSILKTSYGHIPIPMSLGPDDSNISMLIHLLYTHFLDRLSKNVERQQVRQNYIRRRLLTTYKALERLSQSEFNLDRLELAASAAAAAGVAVGGRAPPGVGVHLTVPGAPPPPASAILRVVKPRSAATKNLPLTVTDVERERGKPLSKYDRNMMIFNWLHTLDESSVESQ